MGSGTEVALETADAAVLCDRVTDIPATLRVARSAVADIRQNFTLALGLEGVLLATSVLGITGIWITIIADAGATVLVTLDALRLLGFDPDREALGRHHPRWHQALPLQAARGQRWCWSSILRDGHARRRERADADGRGSGLGGHGPAHPDRRPATTGAPRRCQARRALPGEGPQRSSRGWRPASPQGDSSPASRRATGQIAPRTPRLDRPHARSG